MSAVIDAEQAFAYFGTATAPAVIVKVKLSDLTRSGALILNPGENYLNSATIDSGNGFAYFGAGTAPGIVVKVRLFDLARVGAYILNPRESLYTHAALFISSTDGMLYVTVAGDQVLGLAGGLVKVRTSDLSRMGAVTLALDPGNFVSGEGAVDSTKGLAYLGVYTVRLDNSPGVAGVLRIPLTVVAIPSTSRTATSSFSTVPSMSGQGMPGNPPESIAAGLIFGVIALLGLRLLRRIKRIRFA